MKRTLLSVVIANTLLISTTALASNQSFAPEDTFFDEAMQFGGHVGTSLEYEDKEITNFATWGGVEKERTTTHEVVSLFYRNSNWNLSALYGFNLVNREKTSKTNNKAETEDGYKHFLSLDKSFQLGNGWATGVVYDLEYTQGKIYTSGEQGYIRSTKAEHSLRPYLTYWNNSYNAGFYSNLEYLYTDQDKNAWGTREEEGYSLLFKPYKRFGPWQVGVEFYYQIKENRAWNGSGVAGEVSDFTEKYMEPIVQYTFDDAGTLYVRARIGENETKHTAGWAENEKFFKDIRKATLGYEQAVGDDWLVKAEYTWAEDTETFTQLAGEEKVVDESTLFLQALYRF